MPTHSAREPPPTPDATAGTPRATRQRQGECAAELESALEAGIKDLNEVEQTLAREATHLDDLRRRLREAHDHHVGSLSSEPPGRQLSAQNTHASACLWPRVRETWRETHAALIAARRTLAEDGNDADPQALIVLRAAVEEHLAQVTRLGDESPWAVPGSDREEVGRCVSGRHALDTYIADYLERLGRDGSALRAAGNQAATEIRERARERWARWTIDNTSEQGPPPWERWRNRALFPTILGRVLWRGEVQERLSRLRAKPPGTIYAVFRSIARVSSPQLELGLDVQGRQAILRRDRRGDGATAVADVPALSEDIFAHGLTLLGSRYTLPMVEWLVERAHLQALDGADRPDVIEIEGGWEAFTRAVLEGPTVGPKERAKLHTLSRILAGTPIRWQDGARSSSLFMLFENASAAGRGRGRSVLRFTLDARLLEYEHHRARERFGPGAGPAQWADWRIVPLPRPRIVAPVPGSPRDTYGPQTVALRLLWLHFTRHGDELLDEPRLVRINPHDRRGLADEAQLSARLIDPLLNHLVQRGAIIGGAGSRFAPADPAARAFIAEGWRRSRLASLSGQRGSRARAAGFGRVDRGPKVLE